MSEKFKGHVEEGVFKTELPDKYYEKTINVKSVVIRSLSLSTEAINNTKFFTAAETGENEVKLLFATAFGLVTGEAPDIDWEEAMKKENTNDVLVLVEKLWRHGVNLLVEELEKIGKEPKFVGSGYLPLTNVQIKNHSGDLIHLHNFLLFTEDVHGMAFVPKSFRFLK